MLAIKQFYKNSGVDIANSFNDLPDHLCVEIEFLQLLCYRADEAVRCGNAALLAEAELTAAAFMDRFLLPFANRLADIAVGTVPENPYSDLLEVTRCVLLRYRSDLGIGSESIASAFKEDAP